MEQSIMQHAANSVRTQLRWIPAHQGVVGNELVDRHAKEAAQEPEQPQNPNNRYIRLAAAAKRRIRREAKIEWERSWITEKTSRPTKRLIELPTKKTVEYWSGLRKATTSILIQLRTGRISLAAYLNRINRRESARCSCDLGNQTVNHILFECPLLHDERNWMRNALSNRGVAFRRDELLARPEARKLWPNSCSRQVSWASSKQSTQWPLERKKAMKRINNPLGRCDGRRRMVSVRSTVPGPLYSLD